MASATKFRYQRLKQQVLSDDPVEKERSYVRSRSWYKVRRVHIRKRLRLKVPSLRRFLRRKLRLVSASWAKVLKRLKDGQAHFGDLFAGNYLFLQVNPSSLKCFDKSYHRTAGLKFDNLASKFSIPRNSK